MSPALQRRGVGLLAASALLATAACGSTVQSADRIVSGQVPAGGNDSLATGGTTGSTDGLGGTGLTPTDPSGLGGSAPGSTTGGAPGAGSAAGAGGSNAPGSPATVDGGGTGAAGLSAPQQSGRQSPGVTEKEIFVGITQTENGEAANAALGAGAITTGDTEANVRAIIDEINERGGVAGRKLVPVIHKYDAQSNETRASQDEGACATFTQDNKIAVAATAGLTDTFAACMQQAGVPQIASGQLIQQDDAFFRQFPGYFDVGTLSQERMMAEMVRTFGRLDYYSGWDANLGRPGTAPTRLGVLSFDEPTWNRPLDKVMLPALAQAGHRVDPQLVIRVPRPQNQADVSRTAGPVQNAILRFRNAGVTHVVVLDASGILTIVFANSTRGQRYFPRLGVNSATAMQALFDTGVATNEQLSGAAGIGWFPSIDLPQGQGDRFLGPATKDCLDLIKRRTGQTFTSTNAASLALSACDSLFLTAAALNRAGPVINAGSVAAAIEGLGDRFATALLPTAFFGPGRHDGAQRGYDMVWDSTCGCAAYRDQGHAIP